MCAIYAYIGVVWAVNVGIYGIHGVYGSIYRHDLSFIFPRVAESLSKIQQESIS